MVSEIKKIGIIGGGKMGTSIFNWLSQYNYSLVWMVRSNAEKAEKKYHRKLNRSLKNELISKTEYRFFVENHIISSKLSQVSNCDLIIESISENLEAKQQLFEQLFQIVSADTVLATNSSSILPHRLSNDPHKQSRILGMHFFYPVEMKNIIELVMGKAGFMQLKDVTDLLLATNYTVLVQNNENAFLLNRLMLHLQIAAFNLHKEQGYSFQEIDKAVDKYLFPIGIFTMMDHIGLDTLLYSIANYQELEKEQLSTQNLLSFIQDKVDAKEIGIKSKSGFYNYSEAAEDINISQKELKQIARHLAKSYFSAYNWYAKKGYSSADELTFAMNEYLDTQTETWKELMNE